ncbi:hypothetical protein E6H30_02265 [Candidatus Bathyarchaeota archaeon]|nr:MAG: hypothetical protein E6H30_02265 [Candidatus Bathyarchaeota archaeon]
MIQPISLKSYPRRPPSVAQATVCTLPVRWAIRPMTNNNASFWKCDNCGYSNDGRDIICENCKRGVRPEHSEIDDYLANSIVREMWKSQK